MSFKVEDIKLIEFGKPNHAGEVHEYDKSMNEAIVKLQEREVIYSEFGFPKLQNLTPEQRLRIGGTVAHDKVCGQITNIRLSDDNSCLLGDFKTWGPKKDYIPVMEEGYLGMRAMVTKILEGDKIVDQVRRIVTWDFILN